MIKLKVLETAVITIAAIINIFFDSYTLFTSGINIKICLSIVISIVAVCIFGSYFKKYMRQLKGKN